MRTKDHFRKVVKNQLSKMMVEEWKPMYDTVQNNPDKFSDEEKAEVAICNEVVAEIKAELENPPVFATCPCPHCN